MSALAAEGMRVRLGGRIVFDDFDLVINSREVTVVVGPNGAGKTTLLTCLAGLRRPEAGRVVLGEQDLAGLPHRERARRLGFLPQSPEVAWSVDVETLVGLGRIPRLGATGPGAEDRLAVAAALAATGTEGFAGRDVSTLSGGERARVLIARALAGEPDWLIADEPLTGLDPGHQIDALALFGRFAGEREKGVLLTLHDLQTAARAADRVIVLAEGRILADGSPGDALTPPVLAAAYGIEVEANKGQDGRPDIRVLGRRSPLG